MMRFHNLLRYYSAGESQILIESNITAIHVLELVVVNVLFDAEMKTFSQQCLAGWFGLNDAVHHGGSYDDCITF